MVFKYAWRHVANVMTKSILTLREKDNVQRAAKLMVENDVGCAIIVEGKGHKKRLIGLVTEHDVLNVLAKHKDSAKILLKDIMETDPVTVHPQEDFMVASVIMERYEVKKVPVIEGGYVVGIITLSDIAHAINELDKYYSFRLCTYEVPVTRPLRKTLAKKKFKE